MSENRDSEKNGNNYNSQVLSMKDLNKKLINLVKKPPEERSNQDFEMFQTCALNNYFLQTCLDKNDEAFGQELFRRLEYSYTPAGETLFEAGSIGSTFYIILNGSVEVSIKVAVMTELGLKSGLKKVLELKSGASFGELGLMEDTLKPRAATIICKGECHFATLEWKVYRSLFGTEHGKKVESATSFLSGISIFRGMSKHILKTWAYLFHKKEIYTKNQVIYHEAEDPENIYLIRSGQVLCKKRIAIERQALEKQDAVVGEKNEFYMVDKPSLYKSADIIMLGAGEILGEQEAYGAYRKERKVPVYGETVPKYELISKWSPEERQKKLERLPTKRYISAVVTSVEAEVWIVPRRHFFPKMETTTSGMRNVIEILVSKYERYEKRIRELSKNLSQHPQYIQEKKGQMDFKNDLLEKIQQKKFIRNGGGPNLHRYLENRCQSPSTTAVRIRELENDSSSVVQNSVVLHTGNSPTSLMMDQNWRTSSPTFSPESPIMMKLETKSSIRKRVSIEELDEQEWPLNLSPGQMPSLKFNFRETDILNVGDSRTDVDRVRPSTAKSMTRYERKDSRIEVKNPPSIMKLHSKNYQEEGRENNATRHGSIINHLQQKSLVNQSLNFTPGYVGMSMNMDQQQQQHQHQPSQNSPSKPEQSSPSPVRAQSARRRYRKMEDTEYVNSRKAVVPITFVSLDLEEHFKRKEQYLAKRTPQKQTKEAIDIKIISYFAKTHYKRPPGETRKTTTGSRADIATKVFNQPPTIIMGSPMHAVGRRGDLSPEKKDDSSLLISMPRRPVSAMKPRTPESFTSNLSVSKMRENLSTRDTEKRRKSKLFDQALRDTYGKRLVKFLADATAKKKA